MVGAEGRALWLQHDERDGLRLGLGERGEGITRKPQRGAIAQRTRMLIMATKRPRDNQDSRADRRTARALFWRLDAKCWVPAVALLGMILKSFLQTLVHVSLAFSQSKREFPSPDGRIT